MLVFIAFFITLLFYACFSYIFTDKNLVLTSHPLYWETQTYLWQNLSGNAVLLCVVLVLIITILCICYFFLLKKLKKNSQNFWLYLAIISPLFFSYNALSHDIFNYLFNAKMVLVYQQNPHLVSALEFADIDTWVRFMHNVHTAAPYGYGWTALSLIPSTLGFGKFTLTLLSFRVFTLFGLAFLYYSLQHLSPTLNKRRLHQHELALVFLNPLFLIEIISNYHNDIWMMAPAVLSISILLRTFTANLPRKNQVTHFSIAVLFLLVSISIKLVTVVLVPFFAVAGMVLFFLPNNRWSRYLAVIPTHFISKIQEKVFTTLPTLLVIAFFLPLLTLRSQQFLPWYLIWSLVWLPFVKNTTVKNTILIFSVTSLFRYVPWIYNSFEYSSAVLSQQKMITWSIPLLYLALKVSSKKNTYVQKI